MRDTATVTAAGGGAGENSPRSLVFDVFGEYVRTDTGYITLQALSRLLEPFDVPPDSLRVLMSRLRREGWFETVKSGRMSLYLPSERGWSLLDEGYARIMGGPHDRWSGDWHMVIFSVPETERATRARLRKRLTWLGFGPLAPSTWISPRDRLAEATEILAAEPDVQYDRLVARSLSPREDRDRAARCWDLDTLAAGYRDYIDRWESALERLRTDPPPPPRAFVVRTRVIHEYRKFLFLDPDLPARLLPRDWPASRAHGLMLEVFATLRDAARRHYRQVTSDMPAPGHGGPATPVRPLPRLP
ncbi:PaaX family transcriptional regulator [Embleya hyalina]|uniref:PaaX family transcriptional regulator n=1 Tax=Embleya hyalina TaxID=516124 RepID=A0A401YQZ4_9ACTN|nr:PaaX family transcriptional regulator C-terminal domain-containing protein [Embleya hyalina]GCD97016.1 PaaX family transcriptional regulator [Embleya hyalina]